VIASPRQINLGDASFRVTDDKDSFWDKACAGAWEPETLAAVRDLVDENTVFIDIGGWIGPITLLAAAKGATVLTFEPDPRAFELLSANVAANPDLAKRITLHNAAVSPTSDRVRLGSPRKPGDSMGSILEADSGVALWDAAAITPLDIAALAANAGRIVLKMDVEGAEYTLLPHLQTLLTERTVAALIAFHPKLLAKAGHSPETIDRLTLDARTALGDYILQSLDLDVPKGDISRIGNSTVLLTRK